VKATCEIAGISRLQVKLLKENKKKEKEELGDDEEVKKTE
jgi:hypothetical protein